MGTIVLNGYIHCGVSVMFHVFILISCFVVVCLGDNFSLLPKNIPVTRFFKYSFARLDESDVRSLAAVMKDAYLNLCKKLHGCRDEEFGLEDLCQHRFTELQINVNKMRKSGLLLQ